MKKWSKCRLICIFFFFSSREIENAFTHVMWDSAEAIPTKLKTPLLSISPQPRNCVNFKRQGHGLWVLYAKPRRPYLLPDWLHTWPPGGFLFRAASRKAVQRIVLGIWPSWGLSSLAEQR